MSPTESSVNGSRSAALWSLCLKATNRCKRSTRFLLPTPARSGTGSCSIRTFRLRADTCCSVSGFDPRCERHGVNSLYVFGRCAVVVKSRLITLVHSMDVASISALSVLAGSVVGGLTSGFTTWLSQRAQARAGQLAHDKSQREDLYKDFIIAASKE